MTDTLLQVETRPPGTDYDLIRSLTRMYELSKANLSNRRQEWMRNYRLTMGRTTEIIPTAGVRANKIRPNVSSRIAWMTDQEISCSITPAANPWDTWGSFIAEGQAAHLEAVINSVYFADHWYAEIVKMLWHAAMYGSGFLKVGWDSGKVRGQGPTGEPLGNVVCDAVDPWCLYPDPYASSMDDIRWICEVASMTPDEIERRFPAASDSLIEESFIHSDESSTHLPPALKGLSSGPDGKRTLVPVNAGQGPTTWGGPGGAFYNRGMNLKAQNVYMMWWKENDRTTREPTDPTNPNATEPVVTDRWRVTCWSGTRILLDEYADNLFGIDRHPYVRYVTTEMGEFYGQPIVRDLGPLQVAMNRDLSLAQNTIEYTGNPVLQGVKGSGLDRATWMSRPGQIYDVNGGPNAQQNKATWLAPPPLPPQLMELLSLYDDAMQDICGLKGPQKGTAAPSRTSNQQTSNAQEAGFIRVRSSQRNLELTLSTVFDIAAQIIIINYDVPRTVAVVGPEGAQTALQLSARHFMTSGKSGQLPLKYTLLVSAGASKPTSRSARFQEALQLKQVGSVDNQYVLEAGRVSHIPTVLRRLEAEEQRQAQLAQSMHAQKGTHPK